MTFSQHLDHLATKLFQVFSRTEYALKASGFNKGDFQDINREWHIKRWLKMRMKESDMPNPAAKPTKGKPTKGTDLFIPATEAGHEWQFRAGRIA